MSSSSGGDSRAGKSPAPNKIKLSSSANRASDTNYKVVVSRKNARKSNSNLPIPTSPGLQQIYNNTPILNASQSVFVLNNSISTDNNVSADLITNDGLSTDNLNDPTSSSVPVVISTLTNTPTYTTDIFNDINMSSQRTQQTFSADYNGPVIILVECIDMNKHIGNWHPFKAAKFFSTNFSGITNIKPAGSKKIKISFDSTSNGNLCLTSDVLFDHGFTANIPSNLIYSFGIIKLDPDVSEDDFRDGVHSIFPIVNFKRISIKKDGNIVPTRIVELKFLSPKLPQHISVYNLIFDVNPSIRSPVQCNRCLRYGHTQKFCRSDPRCSHCGGSKHSILECPTASSTDPTCIFCKLPHAATDRSCQEWSVQKDIKKIMATENISYKDALEFKKNKYYTSAFKYTDVWNVRSLPARLPSLLFLLSAQKCSIAILSETWLIPSRSITIPSFNTYRSDRPDGYGGAAVAIHHSIKSRLIPIDIVARNNFYKHKIDIIGVEIELDSQPPLGIWSCYIPSSSNVPFNIWQSLFSLISRNSVLCGDFNSFHPAWGSDSASHRGNVIYNTINSLGLSLLNDGSPTHIGRLNSSDSAIDLSFCSPRLYWNLSWRTLGDPHGSDHIPIIITAINKSLTNYNHSQHLLNNNLASPILYDFNKANWIFFTLNIQDGISLSAEDPGLINSYSNFTEIIKNAAMLAIPVKKANHKSYPPSPPWWNSSCAEAVKIRSLHFKTFRRSGCPSDLLKYQNVCAHTTRLLKNEKRNSWKKFCSNLNPSCSINYLWTTARRFKNCVNPTKRPDNDDWFDVFCSKVAPCYVPIESETIPLHYLHTPQSHVLTNKFIMSELKFAISSRKSIAPGLDNISPALLKHLPDNALVSLLNIFNNFLATQQFPTSWSFYRVIPIPKSNSNTSFRPIALSSSLCKIFEHILKSRLDWWLESNSILPPNLFAFRKGMGTIECLSTFIGNIYHSFNNKEFFVATFIDIRGAFDSVNIHTLIDHIISLNAPPVFGNMLLSLFNKRNLVFSSSFGSSNTRSTFTGLPQGSCLSPLLFNIYMSIVAKSLLRSGHKCLIYADDIVIFSSNKSLHLAIELLNNALKDLKTILTNISLEIAPEKCKSVIFTRRRYADHPNIYLDDFHIPFATIVTYLGISLDTKLRWLPHIKSLSSFTARWSNFLRTVSNTWWGSHPSSLLSVYRSIIRSKLDYGCFLFGSAAYSNWKKINILQTSCLRTIMGYVRSTPGPAIEVETSCPPFNIRCRWLAGKFILKSLANSNHIIFDTFYSLYITWRYTPKSMPVLAIAANSLSNFHQYVLKSNKLPLYEQPYDSLLFTPSTQIDNFSDLLCYMKLKSTSRFFVNNYFSNYFNLNYPNFIIIYTDGSVSPLSAGYSFFIPELHVSFSNNLPPSSSSFTAECCAILEALLFISNLAPNNYLIATDSMSCLQSLISNPFNSKLSPIVFQIKSYLYYLNQSNRLIQIIWIPSHIGIYGNEIADGLAKATSNTILPSPAQIPWTDFSPLLRLHITCLWSNHWNNLPAYFASKYKTIVPTISNKKTWFYNLDLPRSSIVRFNRLRVGHSLLPDHAYKLGLNDSPLCTLHTSESVCDISHLLFDCPSLYYKRMSLINYIKSLNIPPNLPAMLNTQSENVIKKIIHFLLEAGFVI
ncbi:hypothetical protein QTP88_004679 [Uroleucon formosanum]